MASRLLSQPCLLPQATRHVTCGQRPSNIPAQAPFYARRFLQGCCKHEAKRLCLWLQRGICPGLADAESIQGRVSPAWVPFASPTSLFAWLMLSFLTRRSHSKRGDPPSLVRGSQGDAMREEADHPSAEAEGKREVLLRGGEEAT